MTASPLGGVCPRFGGDASVPVLGGSCLQNLPGKQPHGDGGTGTGGWGCVPSQTSVRDLPLFPAMRSLPRNGGTIIVIVGPGPWVRGFSPPPRGNYRQFGAVEDLSLNRGGRGGQAGGGRAGGVCPTLQQPPSVPGPRSQGALGEGGYFSAAALTCRINAPFVLFRGQNLARKCIILISGFYQSCSVFVTHQGDKTRAGALPRRDLLAQGACTEVCSAARTRRAPHSGYSHLVFPPSPRVTTCPGDPVSHPSRQDRGGSDAVMPRAALFALRLQQRAGPEFFRDLGSHPQSRVFEQLIDSGRHGQGWRPGAERGNGVHQGPIPRPRGLGCWQ